jgi:hypothetical protein
MIYLYVIIMLLSVAVIILSLFVNYLIKKVDNLTEFNQSQHKINNIIYDKLFKESTNEKKQIILPMVVGEC